MREDKGSVSVYFIIITAFIFLFNALFIDYARIAAMNLQLELSARAGVRSVLSAYDEQLYEKYGLFGRGGTDGNSIFNQVLDERFSGENQAAVQWLDIKREAAHINTAQLLGTHSVFERQVLEEMKYKAPIDFTIELINRFRPLAEGLKEAAATVDVLDNIRKLFDERERKLDQALKLQRTSAQSVKSSSLATLIENGQEGVAAIANGYPSYISMMQSLPYVDAKDAYYIFQAINSYQQTVNTTLNELQAASREQAEAHRANREKAKQAIHEAAALNEQIRDIVGKSGQSAAGSGYEALHRQEATEGGQIGQGATGVRVESDDLKDIRSNLNDYVIDNGWFEHYHEEIEKQVRDYDAIQSQINDFVQKVRIAIDSQEASFSLSHDVSSLRQTFSTYKQNYINSASVLSDREQELNRTVKADKERKEQEKKAESKWSEARGLLKKVNALPDTKEASDQFEQLRQRFEDNMRLNGAVSEPSGGPEYGNDPSEQAAKAMNSLGSMFGGLADSLEKVMEALYLGEYGHARFAFFEPERLRSIFDKNADNSEGQSGGSGGTMLEVSNQELEYIVYGFHHPTSNLAAAYSEIFAVRVAIRTMEGLIECKSMGHPLLVLAAAIVYGLEKSLEDMISLVKDGSAPLSKYAVVPIRYEDYLRLFMLIHGSREAKLGRIIALIEQKTGYRLMHMPTGVSGEVTGSVNLWFLPGIMKQLATAGFFNGKVVGKRYETTKTMAWSYL
ncbi:TadE/TadG family type IV pilus assembly protein [Paenibacillus sp. GCM10012307]|uniref:Uncharacterized protein n=1 Tax=Paenibacillus roseus TaxID=2798579 RepID=A0A934J4K8_9BACL|nr:hypothetical protein [Paenibacillus roseus]MBJ6361428.1 hypothetical protein [Paenibacillus roseus]